MGMGAYDEIKTDVTNNSIMGVQTPLAQQIPAMHRNSECSRITHREYMGDVSMTTVFSVVSFPIDVTNSKSFPWLSSFAPEFQEWKLLGCVYEFKSLSANAISGTVAGMGSVSLSCRYDVSEPVPVSKAEALNSLAAVSCKPSEDMLFAIECDPEETPTQPLYVTTKFPSTPPDPHFYQFGQLDVITSGASNPYLGAGELWVTYDVLLLKPRVSKFSGFSHLTLQHTEVKSAQPIDGVWVDNSLNLAISPGFDSLIFPLAIEPGTSFLVQYNLPASASTAYNVVLTGGLVTSPTLESGSTYFFENFGTDLSMTFSVYYDGSGTPSVPPTLQLTTGTFTTNTSDGDLFVFRTGVISF